MSVNKSFLDRFTERFDDLDATSRQAYILRLARDRGFFEAVFNAVEEGIMVVDKSLHIRYHNRAADELLALPEDPGQLRVSQLLQGVDWKRILSEDEEEWSRFARQELEILYPERRFIHFYLVPLPEETSLAAVILRDVTESRERTSSEVEQETVKAVSLLAAGVAHEIGNPLNSLYLNLQILEQAAEDGEAIPIAETLEMIKTCKTEVERLDGIISGFLTAIRPSKPVFAPVDLKEVIVNVLTFMRPEIETRHVEVKCNWAGELPPISGDEKLLKQAFYNIIRNAIQAMNNGGTLEIYGYEDPEFRVLEFADSGEGMSDKELNGMFRAFHTTKIKGNGIGTLVIERICREHGAEFGLVSSPGRGTVFQVRFPNGGKRLRMLPSPSHHPKKSHQE